MNPRFFGAKGRQLYGVHHPPLTSSGPDRAVLLCPPAPQEYMSTHWAYRRLANQLAKAGAHVLRFDYFGTGDSAGEGDAGSLEAWQEDILTAQAELQALSGVERTSWVGYRLGASLAWRASQVASPKPRDLVLWDPVVSGSAYLRELYAAERTFAARLLYAPEPGTPRLELLGHLFPEVQRISTESVNLSSEQLPEATRTHLYFGRESSETLALVARLGSEIKRFSSEYVPEEGTKGSGSLLSQQILLVIKRALIPDAA